MSVHRRPRLVVVGSANVDYIAQVPHLPVAGETVSASGYLTAPGGKGLNQAVAGSRQGLEVAFVGRVGDDSAGAGLLDLLSAEGIDASSVRRVPGEPTGVALVTVGSKGDNTVVVASLANGQVAPDAVESAGSMIENAAVLLVQLEIPIDTVEAALARAKAAGVTTILNPAPAAEPLPGTVLGLVDVLVPNAQEATALTGLAGMEAAARSLVAAGCSTVIVTCGDRGALVATGGGVDTVPSFAVDAVDTTAAGDAFCGVLAAALAQGESLRPAVRRASAAGALATTVMGAVPSLPTAGAIDRLLQSETVTPP